MPTPCARRWLLLPPLPPLAAPTMPSHAPPLWWLFPPFVYRFFLLRLHPVLWAGWWLVLILFFLAQGALGWWLYILGGGYSPYPHYRRVVCLRHAPEDGGFSSLVFLLLSVFLVGVEWWILRCCGFFPVRRPGSEATPSFIRRRKGSLGSQWPPLRPHCLPLEYACRHGADARNKTRPTHI